MLIPIPPSECVGAREATSRRLDGELSELEAVRLDAHLQRCHACREFAEQAAQTYADPRGWRSAGVAFRRVAPLSAIAVSTAASLLPLLGLGTVSSGGSVASAGMGLLLVYSVGRSTQGRRLLLGVACSLVLAVGSVIARQSGLDDLVVNVAIVGALLRLGIANRIPTARAGAVGVVGGRRASEAAGVSTDVA